MDIPDLEAEEDLSRQVAAAPAARSVSVMDIAELESEDLFRLPVVAKDHEVDLSLLTACLCPAAEVNRIFGSFQPHLTIVASVVCSQATTSRSNVFICLRTNCEHTSTYLLHKGMDGFSNMLPYSAWFGKLFCR